MRPGNPGLDKKVIVGIAMKPVGLKGELKVHPLTDNPGRFAPGGKVWVLSPDGETQAFTVRHVGEHKGNLKVLFDGIGSIEEAERFRGRELFVPEDEVPPLPEGEYYHYQILGLDVYTHGGRLLGTVKDIFTAGEKDVYVVSGRGREHLIPVNDNTVDVIDVKGGRITLLPMEGYISEDEA